MAKPSRYHCGLPVPPGSPFQARVLGETRALCCPGCQAVAEAIVKGGLESYYLHRSDTAINPRALPQGSARKWRCTTARTYSNLSFSTGRAGKHVPDDRRHQLRGLRLADRTPSAQPEGRGRGQPQPVQSSSERALERCAVTAQRAVGELRRIGYAAHPYQADQAAERLASENRRSLRQLGVTGLL